MEKATSQTQPKPVSAGSCQHRVLGHTDQYYIFAAVNKGRYSYKRKYEYYKMSQKQKRITGLEVVPVDPSNSLEEISALTDRISELFISCGTYPEGFFQSLGNIEQRFLVRKYSIIKPKFVVNLVTRVLLFST